MSGRIRLEAGAVDDREIGGEIVKVGPFGAAQHVADEQAVPGQFGHHAHVDGTGRVGTACQILHEIVAALHMFDHVVIQGVKAFGRHFGVVVPPDFAGNAVCPDNMFVLWGPAGEFSGRYQKRATNAQLRLFAGQCGLNQGRFGEVVIDIAQFLYALIFEAELRVNPSRCHSSSLHMAALAATIPRYRPVERS